MCFNCCETVVLAKLHEAAPAQMKMKMMTIYHQLKKIAKKRNEDKQIMLERGN